MPYGTIKVDNITFTNGGSDTTITVSGLAASTTGNLTVTGTISGAVVRATTVSGVTVTGTTVQGASGTFTSITGGVATITSGVFAAGSAAAPSISFSSDPNTGIYSPGADQVAISTNGVGRLFVDASGLVGINTTSPNAPLTIGGTDPQIYLGTSPFGASIQYTNGTGDLSITGRNTYSIIFANTTERMRVDGSGRLLVGTSSAPANYSVCVKTSSSGYNLLLHRGDAPGFGNDLGILGFSDNLGNTGAFVSAQRDGGTWTSGSSSPGRLVFSTTADGTNSPTERMRITSAGLVGIGTSSPAGKINSVISQADTASPSDTTLANSFLHLGGGEYGNGRYFLTTYGYSTGRTNSGAYIGALGAAGVDYGKYHLVFGTRDVTSDTAPTERLRITSAGLVGIGTSSPAGTLHVNGQTYIQGTVSGGQANSTLIANSSGQAQFWALGADTSTTGSMAFVVARSNLSSSLQAVTIDSSGRVGIGTTPSTELHVSRATAGRVITRLVDPDGRTTELRSPDNVGNTAGVGTTTNHPFVFFQNNTEAARVDESKRLLLGTSSARTWGGITHKLQIEDTDYAAAGISQVTNGNNTVGALMTLGKTRSASNGGFTVVQSGDLLGRIYFVGADGSALVQGATIQAEVDGTPGANDMPGRLVFSTTADGASSPTERMRISQSGNLSVGVASDSGFHELRKSGGSETSAIVGFSTSGSNYPVAIYQVTGAGANGAAAAMLVGRGSVTSRSINAGGTVNASGADYAEYMIKAGNFTIAKGAVCGVTADGQLTNEFADAVSFVVKSTNPAYVGGDTWGSEDVVGTKPEADDADALVQWEADLEAARQAVDRIAFAGQVPVNVMGATPGQYIVPVEAADGGIEGVAKNEADMTLAEYMRAVGKVIAIEDDGRARIIVKVA